MKLKLVNEYTEYEPDEYIGLGNADEEKSFFDHPLTPLKLTFAISLILYALPQGWIVKTIKNRNFRLPTYTYLLHLNCVTGISTFVYLGLNCMDDPYETRYVGDYFVMTSFAHLIYYICLSTDWIKGICLPLATYSMLLNTALFFSLFLMYSRNSYKWLVELYLVGNCTLYVFCIIITVLSTFNLIETGIDGHYRIECHRRKLVYVYLVLWAPFWINETFFKEFAPQSMMVIGMATSAFQLLFLMFYLNFDRYMTGVFKDCRNPFRV